MDNKPARVAAAMLVAASIAACSAVSGTAQPAVPSVSPSVSQPQPASTAATSAEQSSAATEPGTQPGVLSMSSESLPESTTQSSKSVQSSVSTTSKSLPEITVQTTSAEARRIVSAVNAILLTPAELGKGFTKRTYTPPDPKDTSARLPCGQVNTAAQFPNALRTGTEIVKGNSVQFDEAVSVYLDTKTATSAFAAAVAGVSCNNGKIGTTPVTVISARDVTAEVGGDQARAWKLGLGPDSVVLVGVRTGLISVGFTFIVAASADTSVLPNPLDIAKVATERLTRLQQ